MGDHLHELLKEPSFLASGAILSLSPTSLLVGWGKREWKKEPSFEQPSFYVPDFFLSSSHAWFTHEFTAIVSLERKEVSPCMIEWEKVEETLFRSRFEETKKAIQQGELKKAVPFTYTRSAQQMTPAYLQHALYHLTQSKASLYGFWEEGQGILGATPELLFKLEENRLQTMAVAGTRGNQISEEAFLTDPKERSEHQLVVEGIAHSLSPYGVLQIGTTAPLQVGKLTHLWTPIELRVKQEVQFEEMVAALHPTPALGTLPKEKGTLLLKKWQQERDRKRFGAPFGVLLKGKAIVYVAIRNVQFDLKGMEIHAGCGVVAESVLEKELAEIQRKIDATKTNLGFLL